VFVRSVHLQCKLSEWLKVCPCGVLKITGAGGGDTSKPKGNGNDRNCSKMSVILVEGVS
jgi:hypothetical protein